jgi:hypothetical protein
MTDELASCAMLMIDYPHGRPFDIPGVGTTRIDRERVKYALTHSFDNFPVPGVEGFIRDAFDHLLYRIGALEHYISRKLVTFHDVEHPVDYYIDRMVTVECRDAVQEYVCKWGFYRTEVFLEKHFKWDFAATEKVLLSKLKHPPQESPRAKRLAARSKFERARDWWEREFC